MLKEFLNEHTWESYPRPLLVIEIASRSTRLRDATRKRDAYQRLGIPTLWLVEPQRGFVTVVESGRADTVVTDVLTWSPHPTVPPLSIRVADVTLASL